MARKRFSPEQINIKFREAEAELAKGKIVVQMVRKLGITGQPCCRWSDVPSVGARRDFVPTGLVDQQSAIEIKTTYRLWQSRPALDVNLPNVPKSCILPCEEWDVVAVQCKDWYP